MRYATYRIVINAGITGLSDIAIRNRLDKLIDTVRSCVSDNPEDAPEVAVEEVMAPSELDEAVAM
jgi:hypothetical protein